MPAIVVFDDSVDMAQHGALRHGVLRGESCGKCTPCRIGSVRGVRGDGPGAWPARTSPPISRWSSDLCETMKYGSLCALGGFTPYPVMSALDAFPGGLRRRRVATAEYDAMTLIRETDLGTPASPARRAA